MVEFIITCISCGTEITEYYHKGYKETEENAPTVELIFL